MGVGLAIGNSGSAVIWIEPLLFRRGLTVSSPRRFGQGHETCCFQGCNRQRRQVAFREKRLLIHHPTKRHHDALQLLSDVLDMQTTCKPLDEIW